jgi:hypothetical protein
MNHDGVGKPVAFHNSATAGITPHSAREPFVLSSFSTKQRPFWAYTMAYHGTEHSTSTRRSVLPLGVTSDLTTTRGANSR